MQEQVILVDENDVALGTCEKLKAHKQALLHRAFSIFIFNSKGELLLQQRALSKYHSGGLWTNSCCGHPRPNESTSDAANRRLKEEMGMQCILKHETSFIYQADLNNHLTEHEFDHVYVGISDLTPKLNEQEAMSYCYEKWDTVLTKIKQHPENYTSWFKIIADKFPKGFKAI